MRFDYDWLIVVHIDRYRFLARVPFQLYWFRGRTVFPCKEFALRGDANGKIILRSYVEITVR